MKKKVLILLLIVAIVCSLFAFVACKDPNAQKPGEEQGHPSDELISANQNFRGEDVDYSIYFETDGNGKIIALSEYAIQEKGNIIQLEIPEKIGDETITALSLNLNTLPFLRSITIPKSIEVMETPIYQQGFTFLVIYCEVTSKPVGWCNEWHQEFMFGSEDEEIELSTVVWNCENNEVAEDGKTYCYDINGTLYALMDSKAELVFSGRLDVEEFNLTNNVKYNGQSYSLNGIYALAFISYNGITDENESQNIKNLKSIKLPNTLTSIGFGAFYGCINLTNIEIPTSVTSIGTWAFYACEKLTSIELPKELKKIDNMAFYACRGLRSISIPTNVTSIGDGVFEYCSGLTSIVIPESVTSMGYNVFDYCRGMTIYCEAESKPNDWNIDWDKDSNSRKCPVVWNCKNNDIADDGNIYFVANDGVRYALKDGEATVVDQSYEIDNDIVILSQLTYKDTLYNVTSIVSDAFIGHSKLTTVKINEGIEEIGSSAFSGCSSLTIIVIPSSVTRICSNAFSDCSSLTGVYITDVASWCAIQFSGQEDNPLYYAHNLYLNNELVTDLKIPNGVDMIYWYAFIGCSSLESVEIPSTVMWIAATSFLECYNLTSVVFEYTSWGHSLSTGQIVEPDYIDVTNPSINATNLKSGEYVYHKK